MKKEYPKLIGAIHLIALLGSKQYQICEKEGAKYFANVKFWDKDDEELRGDFQVFINPLIPITMNPITQTIKEREEIFDEKFITSTSQGLSVAMTTGAIHDFEMKKLKSHITQSHIALLESVVGVVERLFKIDTRTEEDAEDGIECDPYGYDATYNSALQDILTELQEALKELKDNK